MSTSSPATRHAQANRFTALNGLTCLALFSLSVMLMATTAFADDDAPLQLGSEHLGMTSESMVEVEKEAVTEQAVSDAAEKSEWSDVDLQGEQASEIEEPIAVDCPAPVPAPVVVGAPPHVEAEGVTDYESCVEVAIRSGNGFKAASGVCQTLFPEVQAAIADPSAAPDSPTDD